MKKSLMFGFVTSTWNPLGGKCPHGCTYCFSQGKRGLVEKFGMGKYEGPPRFFPKRFMETWPPGSLVFVQDMSDAFASTVPRDLIEPILGHAKQLPQVQFLLLTKNPKRYLEFRIPPNCIIGATIESNRWFPEYTKAPQPWMRLAAMREVKKRFPSNKIFISAEPILTFDSVFAEWLLTLKPDMVAIGYDNHKHKLDEPPLASTKELIFGLRRWGIEVHEKTLRKAWWEV